MCVCVHVTAKTARGKAESVAKPHSRVGSRVTSHDGESEGVAVKDLEGVWCVYKT